MPTDSKKSNNTLNNENHEQVLENSEASHEGSNRGLIDQAENLDAQESNRLLNEQIESEIQTLNHEFDETGANQSIDTDNRKNVEQYLEAEQASHALEMISSLLAWNETNQKNGSANQAGHMFNSESNIKSELKWILSGLHPADIAYVLEALPQDDRLLVWDLVDPAIDGEILIEVSDSVRSTLIADMSPLEMVAAAQGLDTDEIAELADDLPREVLEQIAEDLPVQERAQLRASMSYPDESVGGSMDFEMMIISKDATLEVVLRQLRIVAELPPQTDQLFVVDENNILVGRLSLERLLLNEPEMVVMDVMQSDVLHLSPLDEMEDAAQAFERYDLVSAPVLDGQGRLIGRLTIDVVVDAIRTQSDSDALAHVGLKEEQDIFSSVSKAARNRAPWLFVNLLTASTASYVASLFEATVSQIVVLAFLMSIVAGIGGNTGNQTMTLVIRALALNQITDTNLKDLIKKELAVSLLVGFFGGLLAAGFAYLISRNVLLGAVMMGAIIVNMVLGTLIGMLVPILRDRMGKDPAVGASVMLTFATDTMGFLIFLGLASLVLL